MKAKKIRYETTECSRCGGTGQYSYCTMYGSTCFKCAGKKYQLTRKGAYARKVMQTWKTQNIAKHASELQPGEQVLCDIMDVYGSNVVNRRAWREVLRYEKIKGVWFIDDNGERQESQQMDLWVKDKSQESGRQASAVNTDDSKHFIVRSLMAEKYQEMAARASKLGGAVVEYEADESSQSKGA